MQTLCSASSDSIVISRPVHVADRALLQLAASVVRGDPVKSIVELITNADDSYRRLGFRNDASYGRIIVTLDVASNLLTVLDFAEGIDANRVDECIGTYGSDESGFSEGYAVRGFYGRGLKEAILGLGSGIVRSIKDGVYVECRISEEGVYVRHKERRAVPADNTELGIPYGRNGTRITILMSKCKRSLNYNWLKYALTNHTSLRDIVQSPQRRLILNDGHHSAILTYKPPYGKLLLERRGVQIPGFDAVLDITLYLSPRPLDQDGYARDGGILIRSKNAIHDATLFKYDSDPYASRIFGEIRCDYIEELMARGELVIGDKRDGLDVHHPFTKSLRRLVEKELERFVENERSSCEVETVLVSEDLNHRLNAALWEANRLAVQILRNSIRHSHTRRTLLRGALHDRGRSDQRVAEADGERRLSQLLFNGIRLNSRQDPRVRVYFDRSSGIINIATRSPSVAMYFADDEYDGFLTLVAELIGDIVFYELANHCSNGDQERHQHLYNVFKNKYAHLIHKSVRKSDPRK